MTMISEETTRFLAELKDNNSREWFEAHKARYEDVFKHSAARFCEEMAERLMDETGLRYRAKVFRIHRDVRFSKDKTPYNAHLHMSFTPQDGGADAPAWMIGLDSEKLVMGAGIFMFSKDRLEAWRAMVDSAEGEQLAALLARLEEDGARIEEPELKRVPAPYATDHPHAGLLRRKGLVVWTDAAKQADIYGAAGPGQCWMRLQPFMPVFERLRDLA